jgi:hypothetical protein
MFIKKRTRCSNTGAKIADHLLKGESAATRLKATLDGGALKPEPARLPAQLLHVTTSTWETGLWQKSQPTRKFFGAFFEDPCCITAGSVSIVKVISPVLLPLKCER